MKLSPIPGVVGFCLLASGALAATPLAALSTPDDPSSITSQVIAASPGPDTSVFAPRPPAARLAALEASGASLRGTQQNQPLQTTNYQAGKFPDRSDRDLRDSVAEGQLLAPCALYTKDLGAGLRVDSLCAPIAPLLGESPGGARQARFPLLSFAW